MSDAAALTVVIPTHNRRGLLLRTLGHLAAQTVDPALFDVVVVADGCRDGTAAAVEALAAGAPWAPGRLHCLAQPGSGAAAARNAGLAAATAPRVLFLDDDILAAPGLIAAHLAAAGAAGRDPGAVVLGRIVPHHGRGALHAAIGRWWRDHYAGLRSKPATWTDFYTGNVSVPRAAATTAGGFDAALRYGEDVELGYRLAQQGLRFVYAPGATARTPNPKPARALLRDFYRSGQGSVAIYHKHPGALRALPLAAYGETNIRLRLARGLLLGLSGLPGLGRFVDLAFALWAEGPRVGARVGLFELARAVYYWRGVRNAVADRAEWARLASPGVPILLYHSVEPARPGHVERYSVDTETFAHQMALLRRLGYHVEALANLAATWDAGRLPEPRTAAISFDDGYRNNLTEAWPVLQRHAYPATLFLVTGSAGGQSTWDPATEEGPRPFITWDEARTLDGAGFQVEAHTVTHPDLTQIPPDKAAQELAESRRVLEAELGRPVGQLAYPYGLLNPTVERLTAQAGYTTAYSVQAGLNTLRTGRYDRRRVEIRGDESIVMFVLRLWTGQDPFRYLPGGTWLGRLAGRARTP